MNWTLSICWCGGGTQGPSSIQMSLGWLGNSWAARRHRLESSGYSAKLTGRIAAWLKHRFGFGFGLKKSNFKSTCGTIQFNYCPLALFYIVHSRMNWFTFTLSARNFSCAMYQPGSLVGKKVDSCLSRQSFEVAAIRLSECFPRADREKRILFRSFCEIRLRLNLVNSFVIFVISGSNSANSICISK